MSDTDPNSWDNSFEHEGVESHDQQSQDFDEREALLESMVEHTKSHLDQDGKLHEKLTAYVRENRLASKFDFENVCELVRCILQSTHRNSLTLDFEDCVSWISKRLHEDPLSNERLARLWDSIVTKIQGEPD